VLLAIAGQQGIDGTPECAQSLPPVPVRAHGPAGRSVLRTMHNTVTSGPLFGTQVHMCPCMHACTHAPPGLLPTTRHSPPAPHAPSAVGRRSPTAAQRRSKRISSAGLQIRTKVSGLNILPLILVLRPGTKGRPLVPVGNTNRD
jgi:hypothetical protein